MKKQICLILMTLFLCKAEPSLASPEVVGARLTDVTTSSFSVVWMTDVQAVPELEVAMDSSMSNLINDTIEILPMTNVSETITNAARVKGIMKVTAVGLEAERTYFVRAVTRNPNNNLDAGYSTVLEVTTAGKVVPFSYIDGVAKNFSNDVVTFPVYVRPSDAGERPGDGDLILLEAEGSSYPVSAFAGDGVGLPKGLLDLNNVFSSGGASLDLKGSERLTLRVFRGGLLYTLTHFRKVSSDAGFVYVVEPEKGFFADINIDRNIDDADFEHFREQYKTLPDDENYNPDYNFVDDAEEKVDVREFSKFAMEYGRTDVD